MKYNSKYDRWVTKGGLVYRYSKAQDKLVLCKLSKNSGGYLQLSVQNPKKIVIKVHKLVWETFNGFIPQNMQLDHINTIKTDNRLENLRLCTPKENSNNPLTRKHNSESKKGNTNNRGKTYSEFGRKFKEHFGITMYQDMKLYKREHAWYKNHNKTCSWE